MALTNFIPTVWAANLMQALTTELVFGQAGLVNREYEGLIAGYGDRVKISSLGPVSTFDYARNLDIPDPEVLSGTDRELVIDQAKGFNFAVDDVDKAQSQIAVMTAATAGAARALAEVTEQYLAGLYVQGQPSNGSAASPISVTREGSTSAYEVLLDLYDKLSEAKVPRANRTAVIPPWFLGMLRRDDRFVGQGGSQGEALLRNAVVGQAAGFTLVESDYCPKVGTGTDKATVIQVSTPIARSYAEQIVATEAYRPEKRFSDAVKGLHVYGAKVLRPEALASAVVKRGI